MTNLDSIVKKQGHYFADKGPCSQSYGFYSSHIWMWELEHEEGWAPKNWCSWTVDLEKTLLECKEIKPVNFKGNQPWIYIGRTNPEAETRIHRPPDAESRLIGKYLDAGQDWRQEDWGTTEDEMVGWYHQFNGHDLDKALGDGEQQGNLACCSLWGCKELDTTEWLNGKQGIRHL